MKKQMYNKRASILNTISAERRSVSPPEAENVSFYSFASNATAADHQPPLLYNFESTVASILYKFSQFQLCSTSTFFFQLSAGQTICFALGAGLHQQCWERSVEMEEFILGLKRLFRETANDCSIVRPLKLESFFWPDLTVRLLKESGA